MTINTHIYNPTVYFIISIRSLFATPRQLIMTHAYLLIPYTDRFNPWKSSSRFTDELSHAIIVYQPGPGHDVLMKDMSEAMQEQDLLTECHRPDNTRLVALIFHLCYLSSGHPDISFAINPIAGLEHYGKMNSAYFGEWKLYDTREPIKDRHALKMHYIPYSPATYEAEMILLYNQTGGNTIPMS